MVLEKLNNFKFTNLDVKHKDDLNVIDKKYNVQKSYFDVILDKEFDRTRFDIDQYITEKSIIKIEE